MNVEKRNTNLSFPIKLNYKSNNLFYSYRGGKSTTDLKLINVNKNKFLEKNKSFISLENYSKNESSIFNHKKIKNKKKINEIKTPLFNQYIKNNNNNHFKSFIENIPQKGNNDSSFFYSYKNKINNSYCSDYYLKDNSKYKINNSFSNNNNNNLNNYNHNYSYMKTNFDNNSFLLNNTSIYHKLKNERTLSSYSFMINDYFSNNKENININIQSNLNSESYYNNYLYNNLNQFKKCNNSINQRITEISRDIPCRSKNRKNIIFFNDKSNSKEKIANLDYSKLNLYSPKEIKNENLNFNRSYKKRSRAKMKSDIINNDISDALSFHNEQNYKTFNDNNRNNPYIYVRKNSTNKLNIKKNNINKSIKSANSNFNKNNFQRIRVNLKSNNIFENAFYVQKNVILIQKNYRMHLACLKKCILKTIKNIIDGTNKLYFIFYRYYFKKMIYILNNAYIKSININIKKGKIIPKFNNRMILNENSKKNELIKPKYYYIITNNSDKNEKLENKGNNKLNFIYSPKLKIAKKPNYQNSNLNKIKKEINIIRNLKMKIINKLNKYKK